MKKHLLFLACALFTGTFSFGQELIQNGDFSLPDDGMTYDRIDSIDVWETDSLPGGETGRDFVESDAVAYQWDGTGSIYQVVGTVPSAATTYDIAFDATCFYTYWGDYVTDVYVIFSAFAGTDTTSRVPIDTVTFTVSAVTADWYTWQEKTGQYILEAGNEHAGENLVIEIDMYDSRLFGYDESWTYLYYDNVSVVATSEPTGVKNLNDIGLDLVVANDLIRITGKHDIESATILDLTGKKIMETRPNASQATLQVGNLHHGVYLVNVRTNGSMVTRKVVL
jgi:hypothetical protein